MIRAIYPRPVSTVLATTNETVLYTAPAGVQGSMAIAEYVRITNITANAVDITVAYHDTSESATYYQLFQWPLDGEDTLKLDLGFQLDPGDTIRVTAGTGNALHLTAAIYESQSRLS